LYELKVIEEFSAAHRLSGYKGKCESLHGHNFQVELIVQAEDVGEHGMVVDFKSLKGLLKDCLDTLDHKYLNEIPPFDRKNPTSESIANYIYHFIKPKLPENICFLKVCVWESENSCASYWE